MYGNRAHSTMTIARVNVYFIKRIGTASKQINITTSYWFGHVLLWFLDLLSLLPVSYFMNR